MRILIISVLAFGATVLRECWTTSTSSFSSFLSRPRHGSFNNTTNQGIRRNTCSDSLVVRRAVGSGIIEACSSGFKEVEYSLNMGWINKYIPGGVKDTSTPFIIGSDKWMSSTAQLKGEAASSTVDQAPVHDLPKPELPRTQSLSPPSHSPSEITRSSSVSCVTQKSDGGLYPVIHQSSHSLESSQRIQADSEKPQSSSLYPKIYEGVPDEEVANEGGFGKDVDSANDRPLNPREECLFSTPVAIVYLVDEQQSPHLATDYFSIVRITQKGNDSVVIVRVGEDLHWPLMKDVPTVKLDPTHYFFTLSFPSSLDEAIGSETLEGNRLVTLNYGVTFPDRKDHEKEFKQLDELLILYSSFSSPTLVHGDQQKEKFIQNTQQLSVQEKDKEIVAPSANQVEKYGGQVVPKEVLSSDGKQVVATEENQAAFWTTMAPNVDDYGSSAARAIATGTGQIIRGIFWVRDSTVKQLESGTIYMKTKLNTNDKPSTISPKALKNMKRVRKLSRATENVAKGVLGGIVKAAGFLTGSAIQSKAGSKIFKLMPGEVALASLDAFGKLFDAVEKATKDVLHSSSEMTQTVVAHKYGEPAGQVAQDTLATAGHVIGTAWTISKLRKALNPKDGLVPSKTSVVKGLAKSALKGR